MMTETPVSISIVDDDEPQTCLVTKIKTYTLDNANNPSWQVAPFNPKRLKTFIVSNNTGIIVTQDLPAPGTNPTTAAIAPVGASIMCGTTGNGFPGWEIYGPDPIWIQSIQGNGITIVEVTQTFIENA